jgi:hypothetical protein
MEATCTGGTAGSRLGCPGRWRAGSRKREDEARRGNRRRRRADSRPAGLGLDPDGTPVHPGCNEGKGVGVMRVAVLFRAGGAAASAHTSQAERAAEAMRRRGRRGEARRAVRDGAWPQRRREGLKPAGPGQPAGPGRSPKARRRSRHAKVSPCDTAMESQPGQDGCRKSQPLQYGGEKSAPVTRRWGKGGGRGGRKRGLPCSAFALTTTN